MSKELTLVLTNDDVHVVPVDSVLGNGVQVSNLRAGVELRSWNADPGCVCGWNAEGVDAYAGQLVDGRSVEKGRVASLEHGTALHPQSLAESPLILSIRSVLIPPDWVVCLLLLEPAAKVGSVGLHQWLANVADRVSKSYDVPCKSSSR